MQANCDGRNKTPQFIDDLLLLVRSPSPLLLVQRTAGTPLEIIYTFHYLKGRGNLTIRWLDDDTVLFKQPVVGNPVLIQIV